MTEILRGHVIICDLKLIFCRRITHNQSVYVDAGYEHLNDKDDNDVDNVPEPNKDVPATRTTQPSNKRQHQSYHCNDLQSGHSASEWERVHTCTFCVYGDMTRKKLI